MLIFFNWHIVVDMFRVLCDNLIHVYQIIKVISMSIALDIYISLCQEHLNSSLLVLTNCRELWPLSVTTGHLDHYLEPEI